MVQAREGRVCPISGYQERSNVYLQDDLADLIHRCQHDNSSEFRRQRIEAKVRSQREVGDHQLVLHTIERLCASTQRTAADDARRLSMRQRVAYAYRRYRNEQVDRQRPIQLLYVLGVMMMHANQVRSPTPTVAVTGNEVYEHYTQVVLEWWHRLAPYVQDRRYRLEYHTLAVLYSLKTGIMQCNKEILAIDSEISKYLPCVQDVDAIGFVKRSLTRHIELFRHAYVKYRAEWR
jgi:hypothetical protein